MASFGPIRCYAQVSMIPGRSNENTLAVGSAPTPLTRHRNLTPYASPLFALGVFGIYLSTLCPTVYLGDSGELTAAAFALGIPHNSGYPLYVHLGKLFSMLPLGHVAYRLNLMSAVFAVLTVWLVFSFIKERTDSFVSAFVAASSLAFAPVFWSQTVCAEVYTLHAFFVAVLFRLLWAWDENQTFSTLALLAFVTGISFANHLQTVMLAPAVLFVIISGDHRAFFHPRNFVTLFLFFLLPLFTYLFLPLRTNAGAAIHWGDPNTLERFLAHVTAHAHRSSYVFTKDWPQYLQRAADIGRLFITQFGILLLPAAWGWMKATSLRWKLFFLAVVGFDFLYSVFLNIISLEITPFGLPSFVVLAILAGLGISTAVTWVQDHPRLGAATRRSIAGALCLIPVILAGLRYDLCNQNRNYLAYEHAVNIFRTVEQRGTLFLDGDNNIFPVLYGRLVEGMRDDVTLYDRPNVFFKMPAARFAQDSVDKEKIGKATVEKEIVENAQNSVYYAVFNAAAVSLPSAYTLRPFGILYEATRQTTPLRADEASQVWSRYVRLSIEDNFSKDFMNRQVAASFCFALGRQLIDSGASEEGLGRLGLASTIGYDDTTLHAEMAGFLTDHGYFEQARQELEKALVYYEDLSGVYNNWGYYHYKQGDYEKAVESYGKAITLKPDNHGYYNNLGLAFYRAGKRQEARLAFRRSLEMVPDQPDLKHFLAEAGLAIP
jgi:tetratricopeptide (TPR) repeat protein